MWLLWDHPHFNSYPFTQGLQESIIKSLAYQLKLWSVTGVGVGEGRFFLLPPPPHEFIQQGDALAPSQVSFSSLGHKFCCGCNVYAGMRGSAALRMVLPFPNTFFTILLSATALKLNLKLSHSLVALLVRFRSRAWDKFKHR